jgi:hypothetical protein
MKSTLRLFPIKSTLHLFKGAAAAALLLMPAVAQASPYVQSSVQSVSGSTLANGNGAVATSQTRQSVHQSAHTGQPHGQRVLQQGDLNTAAVGDHAVAATQLNQVVDQSLWDTGHGDWMDVFNQMMVQQASQGNYALGDWSQAISTVEQVSGQYYGGY